MAAQHTYEDVEAIAQFLTTKSDIKPTVGIICGTGLGGLADTVENSVFVDYKDIPHFSVSTVVGHASRLIFGTISGKPVVCMQGRFHMYEGYNMSQVTLPVRVMKLLGVKVLFVTNAAGGLNRNYKVGDLMILKSHIFLPGLAGSNPLIGVNDDRFGPRFPAMSELYSVEIRKLANQASKALGMEEYVREGVYAMNAGPSFETIAECKMLHSVGADVVGMSTCPEAMVASHCGIKVFGMSLVTNECVLDYDDVRSANHEEVLETGAMRANDIQNLVIKLVLFIDDSMHPLQIVIMLSKVFESY